jgi:hypothetical protein
MPVEVRLFTPIRWQWIFTKQFYMHKMMSHDDLKRIGKLRIVNRKGAKEIARILSISVGTVRYHLRNLRLTEKEVRRNYERMRDEAIRKRGPFRQSLTKALLQHNPSSLAQLADRQLTGDDKARIAEAAVLLRLAIKGLACYGSPFDGDRVDWLVQAKNNNVLRVQVRWLRWNKVGCPSLSLCRADYRKGERIRFTNLDFDIIVGYEFQTDSAYVYTFEETAHLVNSVAIGISAREAWSKLEVVLPHRA